MRYPIAKRVNRQNLVKSEGNEYVLMLDWFFGTVVTENNYEVSGTVNANSVITGNMGAQFSNNAMVNAWTNVSGQGVANYSLDGIVNTNTVVTGSVNAEYSLNGNTKAQSIITGEVTGGKRPKIIMTLRI